MALVPVGVALPVPLWPRSCAIAEACGGKLRRVWTARSESVRVGLCSSADVWLRELTLVHVWERGDRVAMLSTSSAAGTAGGDLSSRVGPEGENRGVS